MHKIYLDPRRGRRLLCGHISECKHVIVSSQSPQSPFVTVRNDQLLSLSCYCYYYGYQTRRFDIRLLCGRFGSGQDVTVKLRFSYVRFDEPHPYRSGPVVRQNTPLPLSKRLPNLLSTDKKTTSFDRKMHRVFSRRK